MDVEFAVQAWCSATARVTPGCSTTSATSRCCIAPRRPGCCRAGVGARRRRRLSRAAPGPAPGPPRRAADPGRAGSDGRAERRRGRPLACRLRLTAGAPGSRSPALLGLGAALAWPIDPAAIDWQPARVASEPWRAVSAACGPLQRAPSRRQSRRLGAGRAARLVRARAVAERARRGLIAWPLTQLGLLARPDLLHYGGLSGVLHAGVACVAWRLIVHEHGRRRAIGVLTLALVAIKVRERGAVGSGAAPSRRLGHRHRAVRACQRAGRRPGGGGAGRAGRAPPPRQGRGRCRQRLGSSR